MRKIGGCCSLSDCDLPFYGKGLCRKHYDKQRNQNMKAQLAIQNKKYHEANKDRINARKRAQAKNKPDKIREYSRARRAKKRGGNTNSYTEAEVIKVYGSICYLCNKEIDLAAPRRTGIPGWENGLHIDHNIPIALGGDDNIENVRPTHGLCNLTRPKKRR